MRGIARRVGRPLQPGEHGTGHGRWWPQQLLPPAVASAAALAVLWTGLTFGARAVGGTDSFGYVSQAYLWLSGLPSISQPMAARVPWPYPDESMAPLGFRAGAVRHTSAPSYPPGLPLLTAAARLTCGRCGPYYVNPASAALLVLLTYFLARRIGVTAYGAAIAAVLMAASPVLLINMLTPMSDTLTAAAWTLALILALRSSLLETAGAGVAAAFAILVRPNLAPLALPLLLVTIARRRPLGGPTPTGWRHAVTLCVPIAAAAVLLGVVNDQLYGSPFASGYVGVRGLFALSHLGGNIERYGRWIVQSHGPAVFLAAVPLMVPRLRPAWLIPPIAWILGLYAGIVLLSYLLYAQFDDWWYLRFLMPVLPLLVILIAEGLLGVTARLPAGPASVACAAVVTFMAGQSVVFADRHGLRSIGEGEERYAAVAQYVQRELPPNAVVIAKQHTGPISFYAGRQTIRFDYFAAPRLPAAVAWLRDNGMPPFIVLEDWEEAEFRRRFGADGALGALDVRVVAEMQRPITVRVYDPLEPRSPAPPSRIVAARRARCADPQPPWAR